MASRKDDKNNAEGAGPAEEAERAAETAQEESEKATRAGARMASAAASQAREIGTQQTDAMRALMGNTAQVYREIATDGDMDAILQSGARLAKGMQDVGWEMMQFSQNSLRMQIKAANELMTCRSVEDMVQVQRDLMRESVDTLLNESARLLEISSNVATEALSPLNQRGQARH